MTDNSLSFDWAADPAVVAQHQLPIAVYSNDAGSVVIRQQADWDEENDTFIILAPATIDAFVAAVLKAAGRALLPVPPPGAGGEPEAARKRLHLIGGAE
jgi:hypothetical protein